VAYFGIPSRHLPSPGHRGSLPSGLGDSEEDQFRRGAAALKAALDLNPRGGYVKGSRAREALEKAIDLIPDARAADFGIHLTTGSGPIAELFRYRLAPETLATVIDLLKNKAAREVARVRAEIRRREIERQQIERRIQQDEQRIRDLTRRLCDVINQVCGSEGNSSDQCTSARSMALQNGIRCP